VSEQKLHVVHIIYRFATGGLENGLVNIINRLSCDKFKHSIVCLTDFDPDFAQRLNHGRAELFSLNVVAGGGFGYLLPLRRLLQELKPDIIHSRGLAALEAQLAGLFLPVNRIHGEHGWDSPQAKYNKKHQWLRKLINPLINRFVVLSDEGHKYLCQDVGIDKGKVELICNGVDTEKFYPAVKLTSEKVVLSTIGRLTPVKNQQLLISAFDQLVHQHRLSNIELRLVGDGELMQALSKQVQQLGLTNDCYLLGNRDDIDKQLTQCDVFVLPSLAEGISNTILEAMACGIPIVASSVGGNCQLIEDQHSGYLFESNDVEALVTALKPYLEQESLRRRHGQTARERAVNYFSLNKMVSRYQQLYLTINTSI